MRQTHSFSLAIKATYQRGLWNLAKLSVSHAASDVDDIICDSLAVEPFNVFHREYN